MRKVQLLLIIVLFSVLNVAAQSEKRESIKLLFELTDVTKIMENTMDVYGEIYKDTYQDFPEVWDTLFSFLKTGTDALLDSLINIYDKTYTHQQINDIVTLYNTPTGKLMLETMEEVYLASINAGKNWGESKEEEIESIVTSIVGEVSDGKTYESLYQPDEEFKVGKPYNYITPKNTNSVKISDIYDYALSYDNQKWEVISNELLNPVADICIQYKDENKEVYGMVIAEDTKLDIRQLKGAALHNIYAATNNVAINQLELRQVNDTEVLYMEVRAVIEGSEYQYRNYYVEAEWGAIQFLTFTTGNFYEESKADMLDLLNGLVID